MSNLSNSEHNQVSDAEHQSAQNNALFSDTTFGGIDGFLNNGNTSDSYDPSWTFSSDQYNAAGPVGSGWQDPSSHQHMQHSSNFRPGARPDQVFPSSNFAGNLGGHTSQLGYGASTNSFARFAQPHYTSSTIAPTSLNNTTSTVQVRVPAQQVNTSYGNTIAPEALQSRPYTQSYHPNNVATTVPHASQSPAANSQPRPYSNNVPKANAVGSFMVMQPEGLRQMANSRGICSFLDVSQDPFDFPISKSSVPAYFPRKSRNDIKRLLASDSRLKAKLSKKLSKKSGLSGTQVIPAQLDASGKLTTQALKKESESSSDVTSSDDSEYESSDDEVREAPPLPTTRPTSPRDATSIREGLKDFHEILSTVKDRWKSDNNAVKQAEELKKLNEVPLLKERVKNQLEMLEAALKAAAEYGHADILDHFGTSLPGVGTMAVFLQDRARESDYGSELVVSILQFLSKCKLLDSGLLEKSAVSKLLPRFSKRGTDAVKLFAKRVENNAIVATKKKKEAAKVPVRSTGVEKDSKRDGGPRLPQAAAGIKRPRPADGSAEQPAKKIVSKPGDVPMVKKPGIPPSADAAKAGASAVTKSSSFISSLQSAKRPVAKPSPNPGKAAPNKLTTDSKPTSSSPAGFSFASVLADAANAKSDLPKEDKPDGNRPFETPVQRQKRLRKEARRNLHVSFKPDDSLVEVRVFEHDPEEELGHDASQMRDVNDVGSEGKMFKLHQQHHEMMDIDDDDDDVEEGRAEQTWRPWFQPKYINFNDILPQSEQNYKPFAAGTLDPDCPERATQIEREAETLLAIYANPSEVPSSPKEPGVDVDGKPVNMKSFGPVDSINNRLEEVQQVQLRISQHLTVPAPPTDINAILTALGTVQMPVPVPAPAPSMRPGLSQPASLANLVGGFGGPPSQPSLPGPAPMLPSQQNHQPGQPPDMNAILAGLNSQSQHQSQQAAQPPADIAAILATLQHGPQQQQQNVPPPPPPQMQSTFPAVQGISSAAQFNAQDQQQIWQLASQYALTSMSNASNMWQQQPQQSSASYEGEQRRRWREPDEDADGSGITKRSKNDKQPNPSQFFKKPCKYYREGRCNKGAACTYIHEDP